MFNSRYNGIKIALFIFLAGFSFYAMRFLSFNYDFESFFPKNNEELDYYRQFRLNFEPDDNFIIVAIDNSPNSIFDTAYLQKVKAFTDDADTSIPYIIEALSITNLDKPYMAAGNLFTIPSVHLDNASLLRKDSVKLMSDIRYLNRFITRDAQGLSVVVKTDGILNHRESAEMQFHLDELLEKHGFENYYVIGRSYFQSVFGQIARQEFLFYTITSSLLIFMILIYIFRRFWGVVICMVSVLLGMLIFVGILGFLRTSLDPMSNLFPILMLVVGISDVVHITTKYVDEQFNGLSRKSAMKITIKEIGLATLFTSITTAIGFGSLSSSSIPPIQSFGYLAALGVFVAYLTVLFFTTSSLSYLPANKVYQKSRSKSRWVKWMQWTYIFSFKNQKSIAIGGIVVILLSLYGISQISTDTHLKNNFPRNHKTRTAFQFIEDNFGGFRSLELGIFPTGNHKIMDYEVIRNIDKLEQHLISLPNMYSPLSPASIFKSLNQGINRDETEKYIIPVNETEFNRIKKYIKKAPGSAINILINEEKNVGRLSIKFKDTGSNKSKLVRKGINEWIDQNLNADVVGFRLTGSAFLFDNNSVYVRENMFLGLGIAFLLVSILMGFLFKSVKMVIISLIPNIIPLMIGGALLGYAGIELDATTSIIFAIAFGIVVDDTIHFLSKYRLELQKGNSVRHSIRNTYLESGKAICITTVILFFGFALLITSSYPPTFYIGFLISVTLFTALISDFLLLPVLLYHFYGPDYRKKSKRIKTH